MSVSASQVVEYVFAALGVAEGVLAAVGKGSVSQKVAAVVKDVLGLQQDVSTVVSAPSVSTVVGIVPDVVSTIEKVVSDVEAPAPKS